MRKEAKTGLLYSTLKCSINLDTILMNWTLIKVEPLDLVNFKIHLSHYSFVLPSSRLKISLKLSTWMAQVKFSLGSSFKFLGSSNLTNTPTERRLKSIILLWRCSIIKNHRTFLEKRAVSEWSCQN